LFSVDATVDGRAKVNLPDPANCQTPEQIMLEFWKFPVPDMISWMEFLRLLRKYEGYPVSLKGTFTKPAMDKLLLDLGLTEDRFCDLNEDDKRTLAEGRLNEDPDRVVELLDSNDEESTSNNEDEFVGMAGNGER
jgi:hypothetical protein